MYTLSRVSPAEDFTTSVRLALDYAAFLGEAIEVLHVWHGPRFGGGERDPLVLLSRSHDRAEIESCLAELARRCPCRGRLDDSGRCELTLRVGATDGYDFVLFGSHRPTEKSRLLLGDVAAKLIDEGLPLSEPTVESSRRSLSSTAPMESISDRPTNPELERVR